MISVYIDANVFIYYFDDHPIFGHTVRVLFRTLLNTRFELVTSHLCLGEVLIRPIRIGNEFTVARIRRFFRSPTVSLAPLLPEGSQLFVQLRAQHLVKTPDALHLATAAAARVDYFLTNDTRLHSLAVPGIGQIVGLDHAF